MTKSNHGQSDDITSQTRLRCEEEQNGMVIVKEEQLEKKVKERIKGRVVEANVGEGREGEEGKERGWEIRKNKGKEKE